MIYFGNIAINKSSAKKVSRERERERLWREDTKRAPLKQAKTHIFFRLNSSKLNSYV